MGNVRSSVAREMAEKRAAKEAGAQNYLEFLRHSSERRTSRSQQLAQTILMQDQDPETLNWDEILKGSDIDKNDVMNFYTQAKQERDAQQSEANYKRAQEEAKMELDQFKAEVDEKYKMGLLTAKERDREVSEALGWYNAKTNRINATKSGSDSEKMTPIMEKRIGDLFLAGIPKESAMALDSLIQQHGVDAVLNSQTSMTDAQKEAVRKSYKSTEQQQFFINPSILGQIDDDEV
jgi:hypothetical protein